MLQVKEQLTCDVLIIGGGIAGLMAAVGAAEKGASVIVAEKADTRRSGSGATGNDHFLCYLPEYHGDNKKEIIQEMEESQIGGCCDPELFELFADLSGDQVREWHSWGIDMKPRGDWEFTGHAKPGRPRIFLKYAGHNQKAVLTREAKKRNVRILNHHLLNQILLNDEGQVAGAVCLDVTEDIPSVQIIACRSLIMCTGNTTRLYLPKTAGWMFNTANCPACTGVGRASAYRIGARLINLDMPHTHAGPKYFNRCGKATWIGVYKSMDGKPVGPFVKKPTRELGDITGDIWMEMFEMRRKAGEPVFMDCTETSPEDLEYMMWGLSNEGNTSTLDYMKEEGIDLRRHMIEFQQFEPILVGRGIEVDKKCASNVPGLYAAGEETGNFRGDIGGSATFGRLAGTCAAEYALKNRSQASPELKKLPVVQESLDFYEQLFARADGTGHPGWKEANVALGQIMNDYAGLEVRSENMFKAGLIYLRRLREKTRNILACTNSHDFMRCLEVLDLMEVGELVMLCGRERRECRGKHVRVDFPFTNPLNNNKFLQIQKVSGEPVLTWRNKR